MRSLDEFYKYIEKQELALRQSAERNAPAAPPADITEVRVAADPAPAVAEPGSDAALADADDANFLIPETPAVKPVAEASVPPPRVPKPALPSRYERIMPPEALRPEKNGKTPEKNGHPAPSPDLPPADVRYVLRGGLTVPVTDTPDAVVPDIGAYIPALRDPASDAPAAAPDHGEGNGSTPVTEPADAEEDASIEDAGIAVPDYLPPIVENQEPTLVADAPTRPRRARRAEGARPASPQDLSEGEAAALWDRLPRHIQLLVGMSESQQEVAQKYYTRGFKESRRQLVERLLDPTLTLEDTARVLGVCPTTVRRYTNRGLLPHHRTVGQQRRFRLSDVLAFLEQQAGRDADGGADARA